MRCGSVAGIPELRVLFGSSGGSLVWTGIRDQIAEIAHDRASQGMAVDVACTVRDAAANRYVIVLDSSDHLDEPTWLTEGYRPRRLRA